MIRTPQSTAAVRACLALALALLVSPSTIGAQSVSFSLDFDGTGSGGTATFNFRRPPSRQSSSDGRPERAPVDPETSAYLAKLYREQQAEAERKAEAELLRQEIAERRAGTRRTLVTLQALLEQLQRLENTEPSAIQRAQYTQRVLTLQRQFETARSNHLATIPSYRRRLAASIDNINVPPPRVPLHYRQILLLGVGRTAEEAERLVAGRLRNPFTGQPYDDVFAFGNPGALDFARATLDHVLGHFDRLSGTTAAQLSDLRGATADEVVCHSNGCRIAQVLIATGMLKVDRLRMLGGDNAALELDYLRNLKQSMGLTEVSLYMMKGDPIPLLNPGWQIMDHMTRIGGPLQTFAPAASDLTYQLLGLTSRPRFSPAADVHVQVMSYPAAVNPVAQHQYENYSRVINGWRASGCLTGGGDRRCVFY